MKTQPFPYAFFEGKITPIDEAKVSIMTNALQYGTGFFGGIRGYWNKDKRTLQVFRLDDHIARFLNSAELLDVKMPNNHEFLKKTVLELIRINSPETDIYLRPFAYVGNTELGPNLAGITMDFALYMIPLSEYMPVDKGLSLVVSKWRRISSNAIPTRAKASGGYINSALARKEATDGGFDEAILLREDGQLSEGSAENIFLVKGGKVITPATDQDILEGITRRSILKMCQDMGIPTEQRPVNPDELFKADEVFLSGTGCQIAWVAKIDDRTIGSSKARPGHRPGVGPGVGPITKRLQEKFFNVVRGHTSDYGEWRTEIELQHQDR